MSVKCFARALGTTAEELAKVFPKLVVHEIPGCWKWRDFIKVSKHGRLIMSHFWENEAHVEAAVKQLEMHCRPRADDIKEEEEVDEEDKEEVGEVLPKKRGREEKEKKNNEEQHTQEDVIKVLRVHTSRIEAIVKQGMELLTEQAVKATTSLPEFRTRVSKVADDNVAEEMVPKRAAAEAEFKAWNAKRRAKRRVTMDAEVRAELRAELEPEIRAQLQQAYNPALAEAVANRVSERVIQDVDVEEFFAKKK